MDQLIYARWLAVLARAALGFLVGAFGVYALQLVEPLVPLPALPDLWRLPVGEFVAATGAPTGWGWVAALGRGDYLNMAGVALLGVVTAVCYARLVIYYFKAGDTRLGWLAAVQVIVLLVAASGLAAGMH